MLGIAGAAGVILILMPPNLSHWIAFPCYLVVVLGIAALVDALMIFRYRPIVRRLRDRR